MSTCRACGAKIVWVRTAGGRALSVDPAPTEEGNVEVGKDGVARIVGRPGDPPPPPGHRYRFHAPTCPAAPKEAERG